ncbi:MAG TPA: C2H2-type zinc finger protein [Nitrososphaeraceae archaeon]
MSSETTKVNKCEECGKSFDSERELHQHMNQEHVGNA